MGAGADPVIRVEGVIKTYGETRAVDGISFEVRPGTIFGMLGPNGAGKTTTVEMLEGLRHPTPARSGSSGSTPSATPTAPGPDRRPLQTAALYPKLTVFEVLTLFRAFYPSGREPDDLIELWTSAKSADPVAEPLRRPAPAAVRRAGARQQPRARLPRRADDRDGPGRAAGAVGRRPRDPGRRAARCSYDALHGGGRGPVRPGRDHGPRQDPRGRHRRGAGRPAVQGARGPVRRDRRARRRAAREAAGRVVGSSARTARCSSTPGTSRTTIGGVLAAAEELGVEPANLGSGGRRSRTSSST